MKSFDSAACAGQHSMLGRGAPAYLASLINQSQVDAIERVAGHPSHALDGCISKCDVEAFAPDCN